MRVLWVYDQLSTHTQRLATQLVERHDIDLEIMCCPGEKRPDVPSSVPVTPLVCRNKVDFEARKLIRRKIQSGNYDVAHAYTSRNQANLIGACRGLRPMPRLVGYRGTINRLQLLDPANWITFWHPRVSRVICVCHATQKAMIESGLPESKLSVVWEGCDPEGLLPSAATSSRASFDIPDDAFVVGVVANMRAVKGIHLLLEAALKLTDLKNIYFLLIGEVRDPRIAVLAADPRIADRVRLTGPLPEAGRCAGLFDVLAAPSIMEGLSMSIMEAMARQVCPVVSHVGGNIELVRDQVDGLVVPVGDSSALARAIRRLHDEPVLRKQLAASAHQRSLHQFSIAAWATRLAGVYRDVAATAAARAA
ncbi:MAG: glycosyltransferase family 4 protein [Planctomycetota bacterium]